MWDGRDGLLGEDGVLASSPALLMPAWRQQRPTKRNQHPRAAGSETRRGLGPPNPRTANWTLPSHRYVSDSAERHLYHRASQPCFVGVWALIILAGGGGYRDSPLLCGKFSSISGLYSLNACITLLSPTVTPKCVSIQFSRSVMSDSL